MEKTLANQATNWREGRRLRALELKERGWKQSQIAQALGAFLLNLSLSRNLLRTEPGSGDGDHNRYGQRTEQLQPVPELLLPEPRPFPQPPTPRRLLIGALPLLCDGDG